MELERATKVGFYNVFRREFAASFRFLPLILSGMITPMLIYVIFGVVIGKNIGPVEGVPYTQYIISGIIIFQLVYATFYQSSYSTYFSSNVTQTMDELLTSPVSSRDILLGRVLSSTFIGLIISVPMLIILMILSGVSFNPVAIILSLIYLGLNALIFALLGTLLGIVVESEFSLINFANVIIIPLVFLSDTFMKISYNKLINAALMISPIKVTNDCIRAALLKSTVEPLSLFLLVFYSLIIFFITYKVFDAKSKE